MYVEIDEGRGKRHSEYIPVHEVRTRGLRSHESLVVRNAALNREYKLHLKHICDEESVRLEYEDVTGEGMLERHPDLADYGLRVVKN